MYLGQFWSISLYLGLSHAIFGDNGLSWAISGYFGLSLAILGYLGLSMAILGLCQLAICAYLWLSLAISGYLLLSLSNINYQGKCRSRNELLQFESFLLFLPHSASSSSWYYNHSMSQTASQPSTNFDSPNVVRCPHPNCFPPSTKYVRCPPQLILDPS